MTFAAARVAIATVNARGLTKGAAIPTIEATSQNDSGSISSNAIALRPTGTIDGDLIVVLQGNDALRTVTQPGGFTELFNFTRSNATNNHRHTAWWKIASSEPSSWTFTISSPEHWDTFVFRISGHNPTTPIVDVDWTTDITGTTINIPAVTSGITNCLLLHSLMGGGAQAATFVGPGAGEVEDYNLTGDGSGNIMVAVAHETFGAGGGTGISTWTQGSPSESRSGAHIYIQPIAGPESLLELESTTDNLLFEDSSGVIILE